MSDIVIARSARKHFERHHISEEDVEFILTYPMKVVDLKARGESKQEKLVYLGADEKVRLLEVITVEIIDGEPVVIHAAKMTPKWYKELINKRS